MKFGGGTLAMTAMLAACSGGVETRTFPLEHVTAESIIPLIEPYVASEGSTITAGTQLYPSIAVRERPEVLDRIAEMVAEHDRPQSTVTLHFQLIEADGFTTTDPAIAEVEAVLRGLFRFTGYRLLGEALMSNVTPMLEVKERESWADYQLSQTIRAAGGEYLLLTDVKSVSARTGGTASADLAVLLFRGGETLLETSVRVPNGQTVVLGNGSGPGSENTIILTVRPEIP